MNQLQKHFISFDVHFCHQVTISLVAGITTKHLLSLES